MRHCISAKSVKRFELAAFGGHCGVNRRATRIQIRRDALLLRQRREWDARFFEGSL